MEQLVLENDRLKIEIFDPRNIEDNHFYTRYNHCGYIKQIFNKKKGFALLDRPTDDFHPFHGEGFPDEFEIPLCYDDCNVGEYFVKIGVGIEEKTSDKKYSNWDMHPIKNRAVTDVSIFANGINFKQSAKLNDDISYEYEKTITLLEDSRFIISHILKNNGHLKWNTLWYSHCFLGLEDNKTGVLFNTTSNCLIRGTGDSIINIDGVNKFTEEMNVGEGKCFNWDVNPGLPNHHTVMNGLKTYEFSALGDFPYNEFQLYINPRIISPEPKVNIELDAGKEFCWSTEYVIEV